ncbi:chitin synthase [Nitzschia inconspicua]|uniref:Chitin synthase n=1 Tax=Nitzschia inconspicua TaxID=303405 RepID=A0A9K3KWT4_9STRA|nr:chitin synthase [Nitzschia inconspicua]
MKFFQRRSQRALHREEELLAQLQQMQAELDAKSTQTIQSVVQEIRSQRTPGREEELLARLQQMQAALDAKSTQNIQSVVQEIQELKGALVEIKSTHSAQSMAILSTQRVLEEEIKKANQAFLPQRFTEPELEPVENIPVGCMSVTTANKVEWNVSGFTSVVPHPDFKYFPGLDFEPRITSDGINYNYSADKVISAIVPCFNERSVDLERTLRSLYRQRLPPGWRIEVVIVMDGADYMDATMSEKLFGMFGVRINSGNPATDPFLAMPKAETIIVQPSSEEAAYRRTPAMENTVGGYCLVVKRHNHRKANSQMWWLGPHSSVLNTKYSLATDCGTVFARTATIHLISRLEKEPNLHAATGFQRIMSSEMQGDGSFEFIHRPFDYLLRMVQRFEFEVDHVSFKSIYDTIGCMHVIPGPCGLFRYSAMGTLREGMMYEYFRLFQHSSQGLIVGNVELVEDRIPGTLLSFPLKKDKDAPRMPVEGWPRTGFVHEALFFVEAEKPLSQLIKQRRRWLNGTFATYIWMLREGIITRSNQEIINKTLSLLLVILNVFQGIVIRFFGPPLLIVWLFRFGLFIPDFFDDPAIIFSPEVSLTSLEIEEGRLKYGLALGGAYLLLYIAYILGHIPHAKPVTKGIQITRYTEPTAYAGDKQSAYRAWIFIPVLWANFLLMVLFSVNVIGMLVTQGWYGTPLMVRILISICFTPFVMGVLQGLMHCDFRCLCGMIYSAPAAMVLMIWFTVWLPAYSTTRLSDLTWGNRERTSSLDESEKALNRARNGQKVAILLCLSTIAISVSTIIMMQFFDNAFPIFVMSYTMILSSTYIFSFFDVIWRLLTPFHCSEEDPIIHEYGDDEEAFGCGCTDDSNEAYVDISEVEKDQILKQVSTSANASGGGSTDGTAESKSSTSSSSVVHSSTFLAGA